MISSPVFRRWIGSFRALRMFHRTVRQLFKHLRFGNWLIPISPSRLKVRKLSRDFSRPDLDMVRLGNYQVPGESLDSLSSTGDVSILSLGLGFDVSFDAALRRLFADRMFLVGVEPLRTSLDFARNAVEGHRAVFDLVVHAAITAGQVQNLRIGNPEGGSFRIIEALEEEKLSFATRSRMEVVEALSYRSLLEKVNREFFDIVKIDIERYSELVLHSILEQNLPSVIVMEIERRCSTDQYIQLVRDLFGHLEQHGYHIATLERSRYTWHAIEFVAWRRPD